MGRKKDRVREGAEADGGRYREYGALNSRVPGFRSNSYKRSPPPPAALFPDGAFVRLSQVLPLS